MSSTATVRPLCAADLSAAADLHRRVLDMEFLSRYGSAFMRAYYRAWIEAPGAIAVASVGEHGELLGVLLGATDPAAHVRGMVRRRGLGLGARLAAHCLRHPSLARDLVVTRGRRYAGGLARLFVPRGRRSAGSAGVPDAPAPAPPAPDAATAVGEITHVLVDTDRQGSGVGGGLIDAAVAVARRAGVDELVLVTPPDLEARNFYEHLGWLADGEITSRSGEPFLRYRLPLADGGEGPVSDRPPS